MDLTVSFVQIRLSFCTQRHSDINRNVVNGNDQESLSKSILLVLIHQCRYTSDTSCSTETGTCLCIDSGFHVPRPQERFITPLEYLAGYSLELPWIHFRPFYHDTILFQLHPLFHKNHARYQRGTDRAVCPVTGLTAVIHSLSTSLNPFSCIYLLTK